jgi:hypothetical protein
VLTIGHLSANHFWSETERVRAVLYVCQLVLGGTLCAGCTTRTLPRPKDLLRTIQGRVQRSGAEHLELEVEGFAHLA